MFAREKDKKKQLHSNKSVQSRDGQIARKHPTTKTDREDRYTTCDRHTIRKIEDTPRPDGAQTRCAPPPRVRWESVAEDRARRRRRPRAQEPGEHGVEPKNAAEQMSRAQSGGAAHCEQRRRGAAVRADCSMKRRKAFFFFLIFDFFSCVRQCARFLGHAVPLCSANFLGTQHDQRCFRSPTTTNMPWMCRKPQYKHKIYKRAKTTPQATRV